LPTTTKGRVIAMGVRSHVLYSHLLSADECWTLLNLKSTAEITEFLKGTDGYKDHLALLISATAHRIDLENAVRSAVLSEAEVFLTYLSAGPRRKFFADWLCWFESEHLKNIFRWIRSRRVDRDTMRSRLFHVPGSTLPYEKLLNSNNYSDLLEALRNTKYYAPLRDVVKHLIKGEDTSLFSTELAIDNFVETELYNDLKNLQEDERATLTPIFGTRIDLLNLCNFHRCMWYYNMILEETLTRMLPVKYKVQTQDLRDMAKGTTWEDRFTRLASKFPVYAKIFTDALQQPDAELILETSIRQFNYVQSIRAFKKGTPGFHTAISYFLLKLHEVEDIIRIIEDVRYGVEPHVAARYLIRPIISGGETSWQ